MGVISFAIAVLLGIGCHSSAPPPFSDARQQVGEITDSVELRGIEQVAHPGFHRFIFEFGKANGMSEVVPHTVARLAAGGIILAFSGVRRDLTPNRPLRNEAGEPFGELVPVDKPPVQSYGQLLVLDDSEIDYIIHLDNPSRFHLHAQSDPPRVILDIERTP